MFITVYIVCSCSHLYSNEEMSAFQSSTNIRDGGRSLTFQIGFVHNIHEGVNACICVYIYDEWTMCQMPWSKFQPWNWYLLSTNYEQLNTMSSTYWNMYPVLYSVLECSRPNITRCCTVFWNVLDLLEHVPGVVQCSGMFSTYWNMYPVLYSVLECSRPNITRCCTVFWNVLDLIELDVVQCSGMFST